MDTSEGDLYARRLGEGIQIMHEQALIKQGLVYEATLIKQWYEDMKNNYGNDSPVLSFGETLPIEKPLTAFKNSEEFCLWCERLIEAGLIPVEKEVQ